MKKSEITAAYLAEMEKENYYTIVKTPQEWSNYFKMRLSGLITEDIEDYYDLTAIREDINSEDLMSYEAYENHHAYICGIADTETYKLYDECEKKLDEIESYCLKCEKLISLFPGTEYEIIFSRRSLSIYLMANIPVTAENIGKFLHKGYNANDVYAEYDDTDYSHDKIKIRISDHAFGGNEDYGYREPCVNIII